MYTPYCRLGAGGRRDEFMEKLQKDIKYQFRQGSLLRQAMTHSSYANEHHLDKLYNNERLEFLGDAVLEVISSDTLFRRFPQMHEGELSKKRASLVCEPALAYCARQIHLGQYLRLGHGGGSKRRQGPGFYFVRRPGGFDWSYVPGRGL